MNLFIEQLYQVGKPGQAFGQSGELESNMVLKRAGFIAIPRGEQPGFEHADVYQREVPAASRLYVARTGARLSRSSTASQTPTYASCRIYPARRGIR